MASRQVPHCLIRRVVSGAFRYLLAILEEQGFRAAADILHTAQPNLSIQARQFQENATVRLFRKARNGRIRPTEAGIAFMALARFLLETRDEVIDALIAIERGAVGPARFGSAPFVDPGLFRTLCRLHKDKSWSQMADTLRAVPGVHDVAPAVVLLAVALLAALPAVLRAARIDPSIMLRAE